ncbi:MAG: hypothetical protein C3F11_12065 [Methylocystaceae bacterium]|nr:MAG: hypothetical protein C3F11_12065 [Methylocystaceae bacterium]
MYPTSRLDESRIGSRATLEDVDNAPGRAYSPIDHGDELSSSGAGERKRSFRLVSRFFNEGTFVLLIVAAAWEIASYFLPPFLFPSIERIGRAIVTILTQSSSFVSIEQTYFRIVVFLTVGFVLGSGLGVASGANERIERTFVPLIQLKQGIPGVCWIIFATLWFRDMDARMGFVIVISTLPSFFYQTRDGFRSIPRDLWEMVKSWRPTRRQVFFKLVLPGLIPAILTGLRVNLGTATRVTITAELLAGNSGIGYYLRNAEEQFRMDVAMAWTAILVAFVITTDLSMAFVETKMLSWRQRPERED